MVAPQHAHAPRRAAHSRGRDGGGSEQEEAEAASREPMCLRGWREVRRREGGLLRSRASTQAEKEKERSAVCGVCLTVPLSDRPVLLAEVLHPGDCERRGSSGICVLFNSLVGGRLLGPGKMFASWVPKWVGGGKFS